MGGCNTRRWGRTSSAPAVDGFFSSTVLLLGFNGTDGSTSISDESFANRGAATAVINHAQLDTAQQKFGSASLLLDGTDDRVDWADSPDWSFGSAAFTIEAWVRFNNLAGFQTIVSHWNENVTERAWMFDFPGSANNVLRFGYSTDGSTGVFVQGAWTPSTGIWYHLAADRSGNTIRAYADGVKIASGSVAGGAGIQESGEGVRIGCTYVSPGTNANFFNGWIDELRITKGVARYASDSGYTVPTAAFPRS